MRNDRGETLVQFCKEMKYTIMNTFFKLPLRRLYTWKSPADNQQHIVRNQIDFMVVNKRFRNAITSAKTYPGADVPSDHNLLLGTLKLRLKNVTRMKRTMRIDTNKLKNENTKREVKEHINNAISDVKLNAHRDIEQKWDAIKNIITEVAKLKLPINTRRKNNKWITDEILDLMEKRRQYRNSDENRYRQLHNLVKRKIKEAKEMWLAENCSEIEQFERQYDMFNLHKKIKETAGIYRSRNGGIITDNNGVALLGVDEKVKRWREYMQTLYNDELRGEQEETAAITGPPITSEEVINSIKKLKSNKATGPDEVCGDLLKLIENDHLDVIVELFNNSYDTGVLPKE